MTRKPDVTPQIHVDIAEGFPFYINETVIAGDVDRAIYTATRKCVVKAVRYTPRVVGSDGSDVTLMVTRARGTEAPTSGDDLLSATLDLKGTADTVQTGALVSTAATLQLAVGDRIALDFTGTLTAAVGQVTIEMEHVSDKL